MKKGVCGSHAEQRWQSATRKCLVAAGNQKVASAARVVNIVNHGVSIAGTEVIAETVAAAVIIVVETEVVIVVAAAKIAETAVAANAEARRIVNGVALVTAEIAAREIVATSAVIAVAAN